MKGIRMNGKEQEKSQEMQELFNEWSVEPQKYFTVPESKLIMSHPHYSAGKILVIGAPTAEAPSVDKHENEGADFSGK